MNKGIENLRATDQSLKTRVLELERQLEEAQAIIYALRVQPSVAAIPAAHHMTGDQEHELVETLAASEARFRQLADSMPQLVWTARPDGTVDYYNQRYKEYTGIELVSGEKWNWAPVVHPGDFEKTAAAWKHAVETGEVYQCEHRVQLANGEYRWHLSRGIPVRSYDGKIERWYGTATDIHETKLAQEGLRQSKEKLRYVLESITDAYVVFDSEWRYLEINRVAEEELFNGRLASEFLGKVIWDVFPEVIGDEAHHQFLWAVENQQPVHFEMLSVVVNRWYEVHAFPRDGILEVYHRNINERKQAEAALQMYTSILERSNRELEEFAFVASHDLQEPLRKIEAFGSALMDMSSELGEKQLDYIVRMRKAADRMRTMINDLLALSRVNRHTRPFSAVDLNQIAREVVSDLEIQVKRTGGQVEIGELPVIEADPIQIRQLLQNLIGNSLKFHRKGVPPVVIIEADTQAYNRVRITIEDNGIGFSESEVERVFQPFQRLVGRSEYEGSGIGLAICRKIVDRHNGTIDANSHPGQGAIFTIDLPIKQEPTA